MFFAFQMINEGVEDKGHWLETLVYKVVAYEMSLSFIAF